jgi:hypothetical protein
MNFLRLKGGRNLFFVGGGYLLNPLILSYPCPGRLILWGTNSIPSVWLIQYPKVQCVQIEFLQSAIEKSDSKVHVRASQGLELSPQVRHLQTSPSKKNLTTDKACQKAKLTFIKLIIYWTQGQKLSTKMKTTKFAQICISPVLTPHIDQPINPNTHIYSTKSSGQMC